MFYLRIKSADNPTKHETDFPKPPLCGGFNHLRSLLWLVCRALCGVLSQEIIRAESQTKTVSSYIPPHQQLRLLCTAGSITRQHNHHHTSTWTSTDVSNSTLIRRTCRGLTQQLTAGR